MDSNYEKLIKAMQKAELQMQGFSNVVGYFSPVNAKIAISDQARLAVARQLIDMQVRWSYDK